MKLSLKTQNSRPIKDSARPSAQPRGGNFKLQTDTVNFTGLNRTVSKMAYSLSDSVKYEVENFPNSNGIVGNLPTEWIDKIPKENRGETIKGLYQDLKEIIKDFRASVFVDKNTSQRINGALTKAGIIKEGEEVKLSHIDSGTFGCVFHLKGLSNDRYVLKTFKQQKRDSNNYHGKYIELNRAAFWQKNAGKNTQMVPFYFGDADAGYMVNKYIDHTVPKCKKNIAPEIYGLESQDICRQETGLNKLNGFQYDYGGILVTEPSLVRNKAKQSILRRFLAQPKEKQLENLETSDLTIKKHLTKQLPFMPIEERTALFNKLSSEEKLKSQLSETIFHLPENDKAKCFKQLAEGAPDGLKIKLSRNLFAIPKEEKTECFKTLAKASSNELKMHLAYAVHYIPPENKADCYKFLSEGANREVKEKIFDLSCMLKKDERKELKISLFGQKPRILENILEIFRR